MVKWPFLGDEKVTLNHLVYIFFDEIPYGSCKNLYMFLETKFSMNSNIQIAVEMFCGGLILM